MISAFYLIGSLVNPTAKIFRFWIIIDQNKLQSIINPSLLTLEIIVYKGDIIINCQLHA